MTGPGTIRARCDAHDRLVAADEPLAGLQHRCGGGLPGVIAVPELLDLVRAVRRSRAGQARKIAAIDDAQAISAWVRAEPDGDEVVLEISQWRGSESPRAREDVRPSLALLRQLAGAHALLDADQRILTADAVAPDLYPLAESMRQERGRPWTDFIELGELAHRPPLHWRLLDDARCGVAGSARMWRARLLPRGVAPPVGGFELLLVPEAIDVIPHASLVPAEVGADDLDGSAWDGLIGRELAPALRQPINRIIANAETIRTRLAGPLADEYSTYAGDIAEAGRHLLGLVEDLADLEAVEAEDFRPAPDRIDLCDCARRAAGILSVRAQERRIVLEVPSGDASTPAIGEFRRVLQVLLNLIGNAIRYGPEASTVRLTCGSTDGQAWVAVADEGAGLSSDQAGRIFEKFERLGRSGDGGSGLGLYISRRLARAMGGDLTVAATPGQGARFVLSLPHDSQQGHEQR